MSEWCEECDAPEELCVCEAPADVCGRCGASLSVGHCTDVEVRFPESGMVEWFWCDECADSFTAWRLAHDPEPNGLQNAPWPAESGGSVGPPTAAAGGT